MKREDQAMRRFTWAVYQGDRVLLLAPTQEGAVAWRRDFEQRGLTELSVRQTKEPA